MNIKDKMVRKQVENAIKANCDWFEHENEEYVKMEQLKDWLVKDMKGIGKDKKILKGGFRK